MKWLAPGAVVASALALLGCVSNPVRPEPNLVLPSQGKELPVLDEFIANLELTDAVMELAVRRPTPKAIVDVQIAAMTDYVRARTGQVPRGGFGSVNPAAPPREEERQRLAAAALALLPYLNVDSGEAELGRAAAGALAKELGNDAEYLRQPPDPERGVEFAADLRDGIGVIGLRRLTDGMADRVLSTLSQWAALSPQPRAILLDVSECWAANPDDVAAIVNALAPGVTAFGFEFRDRKSQHLKKVVWRSDPDWGIAAFVQTPLFVWVSSRTAELVEAAAHALDEQRSAVILGERTTGSGRVKSWQRLTGDRWFGFTIADVFDGNGMPLADRPIVPDACVTAGELVPLRERTQAAYEAECARPGPPLGLDGVLRYVAATSAPPQAAPSAPTSPPAKPLKTK